MSDASTPLTLTEVHTAMRRHKLTEPQFCKRATGDYGLVRRMRAGAVVKPPMTAKVRAFIAGLDAGQ